MASSKEIRISIVSALNAAGIQATKEQVAEMSRSVNKSMANAAQGNKKHWADIKAAWDMGCAAIKRAWQAASSGLRAAFKFETQTTQFKTLVGNIDEARAHMADLKALGDTPPFSLDEFAKASRALLVMTDGALGYKKSLEMIGDAAAATGMPIEEMGQAVGRLYAFIRDGQPLSRAVMQLRNMGVITPEVAQKLQDMQKAGKSTAEIWAEVEAQLGRYKGAMEETEKTGDGLIGAISSRWDNVVRAFGNALMEDAKSGLEAVNDAAKELEESGTVELWASKAVAKFKEVKEAASAIGSAVGWLWDHSGLDDAAHRINAAVKSTGYLVTRTTAGLANGEGWGAVKNGWNEANDVAAKEMAKGFWTKKLAEGGYLGSRMKWAAADNASDAAFEAEEEERIKSRAREKRRAAEAQDAAKKAEREEAEKKRVQDALAAGQKKIDEKNAKEAADKEAKAKEDAAKKAAETQKKLDAEAAQARARAEEKALQDKIKNHQKLLEAERNAAGDARSAKSAAESKLQQAWGWYRDKDSMRAQMEEEKADKEAQKQFEKDFARLKSHNRNWRKAENLSVDDEAVRRVALAKEEKEAAEKHLAEIEKNTADLAAKLDELLQVKG